jgi:S1-C subfamily serine protease
LGTARFGGPFFVFGLVCAAPLRYLISKQGYCIVRLNSLLSFSVLSCVLAGCAAGEVDLESRSINVQQTAQPAGGATLTQGMSTLVSNAGPSYVTLTVSKVEEPTSSGDRTSKTAVTSGSGFIVEDDGYVMTAAHVAVQAGNAVSARAANGRVYTGKVVNILPTNDMALIKLKGFQGHSAVPVSSACLAKGATLFSLGKPHAQGDTARFGTVESMSFGRPVQYGKFGYPDAMVMNMNTQQGESGGPVFDDHGKLAGMVVSTLSDGNGRPLNLAHAVPSATLAGFLCSKTSCTAKWASLAPSAGQSCP